MTRLHQLGVTGHLFMSKGGALLRKIVWMIAVLLAFWAPQTVKADSPGFTATPVFKAGTPPTTSYFDLTVKPGTTEPLAVQVQNTGKAPVTLNVQMINAYSQSNGQVGYAPNQFRDPSAQYQLTDFTPGKQVVTLQPGTKQIVSFPAKIPTGGFRGQILGGIYVENPKPTNPDAQIKNQFAVLIGVRLQTSTTLIAPDLKLTRVEAQRQDNQFAVINHIQNFEPRLFGGLAIEATITKVGDNQPVVSRKVKDYQMAPNSDLAFGVYPKSLAPGDYTSTIDATAGKLHWHFSQKFTVTAKQLKKYGATQASPPSSWPWWWIAAGVGLVVLLVLLWFILARRRKRKN